MYPCSIAAARSVLCDRDLLSLELNSYLDWGGEFTSGNPDKVEETHCNAYYVWVKMRAHDVATARGQVV